MDCTRFRNNIFAWFENDVSLFSAEDFKAHSKECAECSSILENFSKTLAIIEQDKLKEPNPFAETRLLQRLENYQETESWWVFPVTRPSLRPAYMGVGIAMAILLGVVMGFEGSSKNRSRIANNNIESVRSELNVPDIMGDDVIQFSNQ